MVDKDDDDKDDGDNNGDDNGNNNGDDNDDIVVAVSSIYRWIFSLLQKSDWCNQTYSQLI